MRIKFIGRGTYYQQIQQALGNHRISESHIAVNWGLQGDNLRDYQRRYPSIMRKPTLNLNQFGNKYQCVQAALSNNISAPASMTSTRDWNDRKSYIRKPYYSLGGRDIHRHNRDDALPSTHYIQEDLSDRRRYEVRVHAMAWVPRSQWIIQKRVHEDGETQLTWNHHTGGRFITVNDTSDPLFQRILESTENLMRVLGYQFGAADFIVCNAGERGRPLPHYFIEWNLAPGWTLDHVRDYYISAFRALSRLDLDDVTMMLEGGPLNGAPELVVTAAQEAPPQQNNHREPDPTIEDERLVEAHPDNAVQITLRREPRREELVSSRVMPEAPPIDDDMARYMATMADMSDSMNFCPQCGRPVNTDIFGALPRFCPGCGSQVRA